MKNNCFFSVGGEGESAIASQGTGKKNGCIHLVTKKYFKRIIIKNLRRSSNYLGLERLGKKDLSKKTLYLKDLGLIDLQKTGYSCF